MIKHRVVAFLCATLALSALATNRVTVVTIVGAGGEEEFQKEFETAAGHWERAAKEAGAEYIEIGLGPATNTNDLGALQAALGSIPAASAEPLWLVLLGHGTFDGKAAKFNLRGPDFSAAELEQWVGRFHRPLAIINTASASAPFLTQLSRSNRVVITATRSGSEQNYARLGKHLSAAIADPQADLDKDGQTSLLEAFLTGARRTADFYSGEGRLATEHALIDDNGDKIGTPADWFRGVRAVKKPEKGGAVDGLRAHQIHLVRSEAERRLPPEVRARRDNLELQIAALREAKEKMDEEEYYRRLEPLLLEMARLYENVDASSD